MSTGKNEKGSAVTTAGQAEARAFVAAEIPAEPLRPTLEMERVQALDPRHSPTLPPSVQRKKSGPRAPEQRTRIEAAAGAADQMERPATKMQVIKIDPEMLLDLVKKRDAGAVDDAGAADAAGLADAADAADEAEAAEAAGAAEAAEAADETERATLPMQSNAAAAAAAASLWAVADTAIEKNALPSALAPSVRSVPVPAASAAPRGEKRLRRGLVPVIGVMVGVVVAFAVVRVMPRGQTGAVSSAAGEVSAKRSQEVGAAAGVASAAGSEAAGVASAAVVTAEVDAGSRLRSEAADDGGVAAVKVKGGGLRKNDDPYEAGVPTVGKTAEVVPAPPISAVAPVPATSPVPVTVLPGGERLEF